MRKSPVLLLSLLLLGLADFGAVAATPEKTVARLWNEELLQAIRLEIPKPTVHSRNLFHVSVAMWDAWAAYDVLAPGFLSQELQVAEDVQAARAEAISHAAYRVLEYRYRFGPGEAVSQASFAALMDALGYDRNFTSTLGDSPAAVGNRIAAAVIMHGHSDGANEGPLLGYPDDTGYYPVNAELIFKLPGTDMVQPNRWQPLAFDYLILQNGIIIGRAVQEFINPNWGKVTPFALIEDDLDYSWVYLDPGPPPMLGGAGQDAFQENALEVIRLSSQMDPGDGATIDISPGVFGNNPLGTNDGTGYAVNPYTGEPYAPNVVRRGDFGRVMAEFWADGPSSETPPGHWNVLANEVTDHPLFQRRLGGKGKVLDPLAWDVKLYFVLNGAVHDGAIAAWGCKGYYDYSRPISHIRYMAGHGQSSDPSGPSYHPWGLLLEPGLVEVITSESSQPGARHQHLAGYQGEIAIRAWQGGPTNPETEIGGVGWIRASEWLPYQRDTFVTPAFAGYVSGHSVFSRAAAEVLTAITGSPYFPGGMGSFVAQKDEYLEFENGPSETLVLQWATYYDAADQAGRSRLWGGIHPQADDLPARVLGATLGRKAWARAQEFIASSKEARICHTPPGRPSRARSLTVGSASVSAHLAHGDQMGECSAEEAKRGRRRSVRD